MVMLMNENFTLLIADRNRNIREFLQRELITDGYRVLLACDGRQVVNIPYADELRVFDRLQDVNQSIPLLVHNLPSGDTTNSFIQRAAGFVEKDGNNITNLKDTITQVLRKHYPHRF